MKSALLQAILILALAAAGLAAYDRWVIRPALRVGVVDVAEVYRQKEALFSRQLTQADSDGQRQAAIAQAQRFAHQLPIALEELARECHCLVLLKGAVAGNPVRSADLTPLLLQKLEAP